MSAAYCAVCDTQMIEDNGAGDQCPVCDQHDDCESFPCSGDAGTKTPTCRLRTFPPMPDPSNASALEAWLDAPLS